MTPDQIKERRINTLRIWRSLAIRLGDAQGEFYSVELYRYILGKLQTANYSRSRVLTILLDLVMPQLVEEGYFTSELRQPDKPNGWARRYWIRSGLPKGKGT